MCSGPGRTKHEDRNLKVKNGFADAVARKIEREVTPTIPASGVLLRTPLFYPVDGPNETGNAIRLDGLGRAF